MPPFLGQPIYYTNHIIHAATTMLSKWKTHKSTKHRVVCIDNDHHCPPQTNNNIIIIIGLSCPHYTRSAHWHFCTTFNPLMGTGNYSATSNNMKLVHWPLMDGLLYLVQRGGDWAGPQPAQAPSRCTKCNSPLINGQCTNRRIAV